MLEEFDRAMAAAAEDESVKVIIVAGAGKHFFAGRDTGTPQERKDWKSVRTRKACRANTSADGISIGIARYAGGTAPNRPLPRFRATALHIIGGLMSASPCGPIVAPDDAKFRDRAVRWAGAHVSMPASPGTSAFARPNNTPLLATRSRPRRPNGWGWSTRWCRAANSKRRPWNSPSALPCRTPARCGLPNSL